MRDFVGTAKVDDEQSTVVVVVGSLKLEVDTNCNTVHVT